MNSVCNFAIGGAYSMLLSIAEEVKHEFKIQKPQLQTPPNRGKNLEHHSEKRPWEYLLPSETGSVYQKALLGLAK